MTERIDPDPGGLRFGPDGLVPAVAQDAATGEVLMVAFMNEAALETTRATGRAHYWSRSRGRLWRKGETSGHEQRVEEILVNCEENSLLLRVRQIGAVCHDGYATCYYRRLESDGSRTIVRDRVFDPAEVYRAAGDNDPSTASPMPDLELSRCSALAYGAFAFLRDVDLTDVSETSHRLRAEHDSVSGRVADELGELAGVLEGSHRHADLPSDALLEATQVWYWVVLAAVRAGTPWDRLRPDRALATTAAEMDRGLVARLLRAEASAWRPMPRSSDDAAPRGHAALALVAQACRAAGVDPTRIVQDELAALRTKPYLVPYFAETDPLEG